MTMLRKPPPDWLLVLLLVAGGYLFQRSMLPLWMLDSFPNQLGAKLFLNRDYDLVYTTGEELPRWRATVMPQARAMGLDGDLAPFMYPPFVAALFAPTTELTGGQWRTIMAVANVAALSLLAWITLLHSGARIHWRAALWCLTLVLLAYPAARAVKFGQLVPVLVVLTWWAVREFHRKRDWTAGLLIGVVAAIKVFPLVLLAWPLLFRRFKAVMVAAGTVVTIYGGSVLGCGVVLHRRFLHSLLDFGSEVNPYFGNQSLTAWVTRIALQLNPVDETPVGGTLVDLLRFGLLMLLGAIVARALIRSRGRITDAESPVVVALLFGPVLLAAPVAWEHYWLWLLPALGWAVRREWSRFPANLASATWLAVAAFFFLVKLTRFYGDSTWGRLVSGSQALGLLLLTLWLIIELQRVSPPADDATDEKLVSYSL